MNLQREWQDYKQRVFDEGLNEGRTQGVLRLVRRLVEAKFGPLDAVTLERLEVAKLDELERIAERVLTASDLAQLFADAP